MFRIELTTRDGDCRAAAIAAAIDGYASPEDALAAVLTQARDYAESQHHGLWLRVCDAHSRPVFGTLLP